MKHLYSAFLKHIKDTHLIQKDDTIISAFSGGKDSVTQLLLLKQLQKDLDFKLVAAYFNHHIREDAEKEENWVKEFCNARQVPLIVDRADVTDYKNRLKLNLENAASILRSRFLQDAAAGYPNAKIATAHTRSDLVETFFIKLLRGSGGRGLSAIFEKVGDNIIRPLLIFSQAEVLAFLERNKVSYYLDYTNKQERFLRNKIRLKLIPEIEKIAPDIETHVYKTVTQIQKEYAYFKELAGEILDEHLLVGKILPVKAVLGRHLAVQRHLMREYIRVIKGNLLNIDFEHVERILDNIPLSRGVAVPDVEITIRKGFIFPRDLYIPPFHISIPGPGRYALPEINAEIRVEETESFVKPGDNDEIYIPFSRVHFPLTLRPARQPDKYVKMNCTLNQKVFEMIRAANYPSELRNLCPLLLDKHGKIIWVAGSPIADAFKVTDVSRPPFIRVRIVRKK